MKIAVITPYYDEPLWKLERCHESVLRQSTGDVTHFMIADGQPREEIDTWGSCVHIQLPQSHNDSGDTPRLIGCASASAQRFEAITFLDADNWYAPNHLDVLQTVQEQTQALVVTCRRYLCRPDTGEVLGVCAFSDGQKFSDTNCLFVMNQAFPVLSAWGLRDNQSVDNNLCLVGDRVVWEAVVKSGVRRAHVHNVSVYYETTFADPYLQLGMEVPEFAKILTKEGDKVSLVPYHNRQA